MDQLEKGDYMSVIDLKSAYRSVNVAKEHTKFQGFSWNMGEGDEFYENNRLSFGLRCAPYIFSKLSDFLAILAKSYGVGRLVNYLDDFLIIAGSEDECRHQRDLLIEIMEYLGFEVSYNKVTEPCQITTFLGITIDSLLMELTLPVEKLDKLNKSLDACLRHKYVTKKLLQKVGGLMSFCSQVVRGGRTFSRRLFDLCAIAKERGSIFLTEETRKDLRWWKKFCSHFNCKSLIQRDLTHVPMVSDASTKGFGAWAGKDYFYGVWNKDFFQKEECSHRVLPPLLDRLDVHEGNINVYELYPVMLGLKRWGHSYRNTKVHVVTDNMQVLAMINTGRSRNKMCMEMAERNVLVMFHLQYCSVIRTPDKQRQQEPFIVNNLVYS